MTSLSNYDVMMTSQIILAFDKHSWKNWPTLIINTKFFGSFWTKTLLDHISRRLAKLPVTCLLPVCFILFEQATHIVWILKFDVLTSSDLKWPWMTFRANKHSICFKINPISIIFIAKTLLPVFDIDHRILRNWCMIRQNWE